VIAVKTHPIPAQGNSARSTVFSRRWTPQPKRRRSPRSTACWRSTLAHSVAAGPPWSAFGEDPYKAKLVAWHGPGAGHDDDQIGPLWAMRSTSAVHQSRRQSGLGGDDRMDRSTPQAECRAGGHPVTRCPRGRQILYSDIRAFTTVRDALADDGSHFSANTSVPIVRFRRRPAYACRDGRLANDIARSPSQGRPVRDRAARQRAVSCGQRVRRIVIPRSVTALGGRRPGRWVESSAGVSARPRDECIRRHRFTAESPAKWTNREIAVLTTLFPFVDRGADPRYAANRWPTSGGSRRDTPTGSTPNPSRHGRSDDRWAGSEIVGHGQPAAHRPLRLDSETLRTRGDRPPAALESALAAHEEPGGWRGGLRQGDIRLTT